MLVDGWMDRWAIWVEGGAYQRDQGLFLLQVLLNLIQSIQIDQILKADETHPSRRAKRHAEHTLLLSHKTNPTNSIDAPRIAAIADDSRILQTGTRRRNRLQHALDQAIVRLVVAPQHAELFADAVETIDVRELRRREHVSSQRCELGAVAGFFAGDEGVAVVPIFEEVVK